MLQVVRVSYNSRCKLKPTNNYTMQDIIYIIKYYMKLYSDKNNNKLDILR